MLTEKDYQEAAKRLQVEVAVIKAVDEVESRGNGFLESGKPKILFEGHWFHKFTKGIYDIEHPTISYPRWTKQFYLGGEKEYERYFIASALNLEAAMLSTSWGRFQIMGFNHDLAGYDKVVTFVEEMQLNEKNHLLAFCRFIEKKFLDNALRNKKWEEFAERYNGSGFKINNYHVKLEKAYKKFEGII